MQKKTNLTVGGGRRIAMSVSIEALEGRELLSAAFMEAGGRLVVRGTAGNDKIVVSRNPVNRAQIRAVVNGKSFDFSSKFIKQVKVEAGSGNDLVLGDASKGSIGVPLMILGGAGRDTLLTSTGN